MDRGRGPDPGQLCAPAEDRPARRGSYSAAADGAAFSPHLGSERRPAGPAAVAGAPPPSGPDADADQERAAAFDVEPGSAEEAATVEPRRPGGVGKASLGRLDGAAARGPAGVAGDAGKTGRGVGRGGEPSGLS